MNDVCGTVTSLATWQLCYGSGSEQEESVHIDEVTRLITCNSIFGYRVIYRDVVTF